jgi:hypothetical protein
MKKSASLLALSAILLLPGCGFHPMHGKYAAAQAAQKGAGLDTVEIANIRDANGTYLRNALIDRFYSGGYPSAPRYTLTVTPVLEREVELDITKSSEATRSQLRLETVMTLTDKQNPGSPVLQRSLRAISSYNQLESEFATHVTEQAARESGLNDLARQIELNISLFLNRTSP